MGTKMPRSPSPPAEASVPLTAPHDTQELQINAILQGIAAENNFIARNRRKKPKIERQESILLPPQPTRKELAEIRKHNLEVRSEVYRAVRRPGKDFTKLFEYLKQLKGSVDIKKEVIRDVISESLRFKRKALAKLLEDFLAGLEKNGNSASVNLKRINTNSHS